MRGVPASATQVQITGLSDGSAATVDNEGRSEELEVVVVPVGDGVILSGIAKGFADLKAAGGADLAMLSVAVREVGNLART